MNGQIANASDVAFTVRSYEAGIGNHVTLPTLCNYMQEAAGISAARLGWGIQALQAEGPVVCEVFVTKNLNVEPRIKSIAAEDGTFIMPNYENLYPDAFSKETED